MRTQDTPTYRWVPAAQVVVAAFWGCITATAFTEPLGWWLVPWVVGTGFVVASVVAQYRFLAAMRDIAYWRGRRDELSEFRRAA